MASCWLRTVLASYKVFEVRGQTLIPRSIEDRFDSCSSVVDTADNRRSFVDHDTTVSLIGGDEVLNEVMRSWYVDLVPPNYC